MLVFLHSLSSFLYYFPIIQLQSAKCSMEWRPIRDSSLGVHTSVPSRQPNSSETLLATDMAATLLGWVQPILPYPSSARYWVICVVLPEPAQEQKLSQYDQENQYYQGSCHLVTFVIALLSVCEQNLCYNLT